MEINSRLIIICGTIARTTSSATALLLCSHSVHPKPRETAFIFWRDFSQNNPQQWSYCTACHTFQQRRVLVAEGDVPRSSPHLCRFWCLNWFLGQLADAAFPPFFFTSCSGISSIRSEELAQGNRFIGKCRLHGVSGGLQSNPLFPAGLALRSDRLCRTLFSWILTNLQGQGWPNLGHCWNVVRVKKVLNGFM